MDPTVLSALDLLLRGGACALLLLIACLLLRDYGSNLAARLGALFAFGAGAYTICSASGFHAYAGGWALPILALASGNNLVFFLFAKALFDDGFVPRWHYGALWLLIVAAGQVYWFVLLPHELALAPIVGAALAAQALIFALLAGFQAAKSWRADLIEPRRRLRSFIVAAATVHTAVTALGHLFSGPSVSPFASTFEAACLFAVAAIVIWSLVRVAGGDALFAAPLARGSGEATTESPAPSLDPADQGLIAALQRRMTSERLYRQSGLSIGELAHLQRLPEYKLRRLINQGLGHRNFNAFLNLYRLAEAKAALADPSQAEVPVLTIALDAGFNSLGPFNRAFKAETGMTPSEFRSAALARGNADFTDADGFRLSAGRISN